MQKKSKNGSSIFVDNIIIEIHIWHFFCFIKSIFNKIDQGLMNIYKTLYMQNTIWSLLQDDIHNMNK